jgi:hypothetical protein
MLFDFAYWLITVGLALALSWCVCRLVRRIPVLDPMHRLGGIALGLVFGPLVLFFAFITLDPGMPQPVNPVSGLIRTQSESWTLGLELYATGMFMLSAALGLTCQQS